MTDEQMLELAETCGFGTYTNDDGTPSDYFDCYAEQLLKFARCLLDYGFSEGHKEGYDEGVNDERMYPENGWSDL